MNYRELLDQAKTCDTTRIAVCLTSHDRLDCSRINQEIFKLNFVHPYVIVHASSGPNAEPYLEDTFISCNPRPHFEGAVALMQSAIKAVLPYQPEFIVLLEGDTWLLDEQILLGIIQRLQANPRFLMASSSWMPAPRTAARRLAKELYDIKCIPGERLLRMASLPRRMAYDAFDLGTQFCILRNDPGLLEVFCAIRLQDPRLVERRWFDRFSTYYSLKRILRIREREPVHPNNRFVCERLALYSQHWPTAGTSTDPRDETNFHYVKPGTPGKREALLRYPHISKGQSIQRLLQAKHPAETNYYNAGARRY